MPDTITRAEFEARMNEYIAALAEIRADVKALPKVVQDSIDPLSALMREQNGRVNRLETWRDVQEDRLSLLRKLVWGLWVSGGGALVFSLLHR